MIKSVIICAIMAITALSGSLCAADYNWNIWPGSAKKIAAISATSNNVTPRIYSLNIREITPVNFAVYTYLPVTGNRRYSFKYRVKFSNFTCRGTGQRKAVCQMKAATDKSYGGIISLEYNPMDKQGVWKDKVIEFQTAGNTSVCQLILFQLDEVKGNIQFEVVSFGEVKDKQPVKTTAAAPVIDGKLNDNCWKDAVAVTEFYTQAKPAAIHTTAYLSYDRNNLYVAFKNDEPAMSSIIPKQLQAHDDGNLWKDESNEVYLALPGNRVFQFCVDSFNRRFDGQLTQRCPGEPYECDKSWNGPWQSRVFRGSNYWISEFQIPWSTLGFSPVAGANLRINLTRLRHLDGGEYMQYNRCDGMMNMVEKFASLDFQGNQALLTRYSEQVSSTPFLIKREKPLFEELLTDQPGDYVVGMWASGYPSPADKDYKTNPEQWKRKLDEMYKALGDSGTNGPAFPWTSDAFKEKGIAELHQAYNVKFWMPCFNSDYSRAAAAKGARFGKGSFDLSDPVMQEATLEIVENEFKAKKWIADYLAYIIGIDEPANHTLKAYSKSENKDLSAELDTLEQTIKQQYGFDKFGLYDHYSENVDANAPFERIAFWRWWNDNIAAFFSKQHAQLQRLAPGVPFIAIDVNCTSTLMPVFDISKLGQHTDGLAGDPYPSATRGYYGLNRALYHTGFTTKLINSLAKPARTAIYLQGFPYHAYTPTPADAREWASQALKNGADIILWFCMPDSGGTTMKVTPELYREILRLNSVIKNMKKLQLPQETKTAILFANNNLFAEDDRGQHSYYSLYTLLGEKLKSNFDFVSDTQLTQTNQAALDKYKLVYVPALKYSDRETMDKLVDYVNNGGTLMVFDPEAFQWNIDGTSGAEVRKNLLGGSLLKARTADRIIYRRGNDKLELPLTGVVHKDGANGNVLAYDIQVPADAEVIGWFPDGKPAVYSRTVGKGKVIVWAAQPFGNSDLAIRATDWNKFFRIMADANGEKTGLPSWDFALPAPASSK